MSTILVIASPAIRRGLSRFFPAVTLPVLLSSLACDSASTEKDAGGTAGEEPSVSCAPGIIDDLEDGDGNICESEGRQGAWYAADDGTGTLVTGDPSGFAPSEITGGRETSLYAARMQGSGFSSWGGLMGLNLNNGTGVYDASDAGGISFWMKSTAPVVLSVPIPETIPSSQPPGTCDGGDECYRKFNAWVGGVSSDWVEHRVPFAALRRVVGDDVAWDPERLVAIEFSSSEADFDVWVDDVSFYACEGDDCVPTCHEEAFPVACPASRRFPASCWPEGTDCDDPEDVVFGAAVWGSAPDDVWIAGYSTVSLGGAVLHWDGSNWSDVAADALPVQWGLWGSDDDDLWSIGDFGSVLYWDGSEWSSSASGTTSHLTNGLWGTGPNDVWAAGLGGTLLHFDGSGWSETPSGTSADLWGVWSSDEDDAWAAGAGGTLLHWDGAEWSSVDSGTDLHLDAVWGSAADDVWAVGEAGTILHWDGSEWAQVESNTERFLELAWGFSDDDVWAVGEEGTVLHWDGSEWSATTSGTEGYLMGLWGTASDDVWAAGEGIIHWDGSSWTTVVGLP